MDHQSKVRFLESQLFTLVVLQSVKDSPQLNDKAKEACESAMIVTTTAIDTLVADEPGIDVLAQSIIQSFEVSTNGKA